MDPNAAAPSHLGEGDETEAAVRSRMLRKRTKTGCLTCRRRRIKCGEERPICKNCIKSKRNCEGYSQRVVFRPQQIDYQSLQGGAANITFPASNMGVDIALASSGVPIAIAPYSHHLTPHPIDISAAQNQYGTGAPHSAPVRQHAWPFGPTQAPSTLQHHPHYDLHAAALGQQPQYLQQHPPSLDPSTMAQSYFPPPMASAQFAPGFVLQDGQPARTIPPTPGSLPDAQWPQSSSSIASSPSYVPHPAATFASAAPLWSSTSVLPPTPITASLNNVWSNVAPVDPASGQPVVVSNVFHEHHLDAPTHNMSQFKSEPTTVDLSDAYTLYMKSEQLTPELLSAAAVEYHDDNYYDVNAFSEPDAFTDTPEAPMTSQELALEHILQLGDLQLHEKLQRNAGYSDGILDAYRPEQAANPLRNPATARVFAHFIHVTAPTISSTARGPLSRTRLERHNIPLSQQSLWEHVMPLVATQDQGLLHAILALSSLHIAKLTGASSTPSYKHYAYALKSVHQAVGKSKSRNSVAVMGASQLLAMYELWCAEHVKWSSHLAGEAQLLVEADFALMQRKIQHLKLQKAAEERQGFPSLQRPLDGSDLSPRQKVRMRQFQEVEHVRDVNSQLVSLLSGRIVDYESHGHVLGDGDPSEDLDDVDVATFETQKDLFWYFARQDMIGSIISANPLLMSYGRWTDCPPRAPVNDPDAVCGTHDHLVLLMGRMAEFAVRDRTRKLKAMESTGGRWRPPPWMQLPSPPNASAAQTEQDQHMNGAKLPSPTTPAFYGMAPIPPAPGMPSSYHADADQARQARSPEHEALPDMQEARTMAVEEWTDMLDALDTLESMLGEVFQPLPVAASDTTSPFGPPITYVSSDLCALWNYIMLARIFAQRCHPDMPPHAHMAAAVTAKQTMQYALHIGRICAGVMPLDRDRTIHPHTATVMCDLSLPLFFAGVQIVDAAQRDWIVTALFDIERKCGYETAGVIAYGCQTAWQNSGKAGHGPPHEIRYNTSRQDGRVKGSWIRAEPRSPSDENDDTDRRFTSSNPAARLHWAVGLLGTEGDG